MHFYTRKEGILKRRPYLGINVYEGKPTFNNLESVHNNFLCVTRVERSSPADQGKIKTGDIILTAKGERIHNLREFVSLCHSMEVGENIEFVLARGEKLHTAVIKPQYMPLEETPGIFTIYSDIKSDGLHLRTISTIPEGNQQWPTILLFQGLECKSVDSPFNPYHMYRRIASMFTRLGFAVVRLERRGTADSEGFQTQDLDFRTELHDYEVFIRATSTANFVDKRNINIFGYSIGGVFVPFIESSFSLKSYTTFGTVGLPWNEYVIDTTRRQWRLMCVDEKVIKTGLHRLATVLDLVNTQKITPQAVATEHPDLANLTHEYRYSRHFSYFQQLADVKIPTHWSNIKAPSLIISGSGDYIASVENQSAIFKALSREALAKGSKLLQLPVDHALQYASCPEESFQRQNDGQFYTNIFTCVAKWLNTYGKI